LLFIATHVIGVATVQAVTCIKAKHIVPCMP